MNEANKLWMWIWMWIWMWMGCLGWDQPDVAPKSGRKETPRKANAIRWVRLVPAFRGWINRVTFGQGHDRVYD